MGISKSSEASGSEPLTREDLVEGMRVQTTDGLRGVIAKVRDDSFALLFDGEKEPMEYSDWTIVRSLIREVVE